MNDKTDGELLTLYCRDGSETAFQALMQRHASMVYGTAMRQLDNSELAQDAVQNVFLALAKKGRQLAGHRNVAGWLYRTALLEARHLRRGEIRRKLREEVAVQMEELMKSNVPQNLKEELDDALLQLREKDRELLILRFLEGRTLAETGSILGIQEDACRKRVDQVLKKLSRQFDRRGSGLSGAALGATLLAESSKALPVGLIESTMGFVVAHFTPSAGVLGPALWNALAFLKAIKVPLISIAIVVPLAYDANRLISAHQLEQTLRDQVGTARESYSQLREDVMKVQRTARSREAFLLALETRARYQQNFANLANHNSPELFRWDPDSDYVRIPKSLLARLSLTELKESEKFKGQFERPKILSQDGKLSAVLLDALGLSEPQRHAAVSAFKDFSAGYLKLVEQHSYFTNLVRDFADPKATIKKVRVIDPFVQEGEALKNGLVGTLTSIMGEERSKAILQQCSESFESEFFLVGQKRVFEGLATYPPEHFLGDTYYRVVWTENPELESIDFKRFDKKELPKAYQTWWLERFLPEQKGQQ